MVSIPTTVKVAFVLLAVGLVVFLIGFATPYWSHREFKPSRRTVNYLEGSDDLGLWRFCYDYKKWQEYGARRGRMEHHAACLNLIGDGDNRISDELRATQFFETVGLLAIIPGFLCLILGMCIESCKDRRICPILSAVFCLVAAACILLGTIIFGAADIYKDDLSWSFALAIVGGILVGVSGVLVIIGAILKK